MEASSQKIFVGTAGWNIPKQYASIFPEEGSHLARYSQVFNCVEINSSFYRDHKPETYARWASEVGSNFRFSVKLAKYFVHQQKLRETGSKLKEVILGISELGEKWGSLLVQLPPKMEFEHKVVRKFISDLRKMYLGTVLWEPRHKSWSSQDAVDLLADYRVNKVLADPEPCMLSKARRVKLERIQYFRLHGTPEIYRSQYDSGIVERVARQMKISSAQETWCIFDNTTFGFATLNAHQLKDQLQLLLAE